MKKSIFILIFILIFTAIFSIEQHARIIVKDNAALKSSTLELETPWEFYWKKFVHPLALYQGTAEDSPNSLVTFPVLWNNLVDDNDAKKGQGFATWHTRVENLKPNYPYAIFLFDIPSTAMNMYVNGIFVGHQGVPTRYFKNTVPGRNLSFAFFTSDSDGVVDITIHNSNYVYRKGGIWGRINISEHFYIQKIYNEQLNRSYFFVGVLAFVILYNFFVFIFRKYSWGSFFLSLFTLAILVRLVSDELALLYRYIPHLSYWIDIKLEFSALTISPVFFLLYLMFTYSTDFVRLIDKIVFALGIFLFILTWALPLYYSNRLVLLYQIYMISSSIIVLPRFFLNTKKSHPDMVYLTLLSVIFVLIGATHDMLALRLIRVPFVGLKLLPYTFVIFVIFQSVIAARRNQIIHSTVQSLSEELTKINNAYFRFVPKQFLELLNKDNIMEVDVGDWTSRHITLLCADIRNFTTLSEQMTGEQTFNFLNMYLMKIGPLIRKHGGFIEKYLGDGIIALFPKNNSSVFDCALEMQAEVMALRKSMETVLLENLRIGIGIHYGDVVFGTAGIEQRMAEISVSEAVETVMRLESLTKLFFSPILVSESAKNNLTQSEDVSYNFEFFPVDTKRLKRPLREKIFSLSRKGIMQ